MEIPSSAAPFFQEYAFDRLDPHAHAPLIIERILAYGSRAELRWLVQQYGWQTVRDWISLSGRARLPRRRYTLWCIVFDLPQEEQSQGIWPY